MTEEQIRRIIRIEILSTVSLLTEYIGRKKPNEDTHDVLRKLKWKLTSQLEDL